VTAAVWPALEDAPVVAAELVLLEALERELDALVLLDAAVFFEAVFFEAVLVAEAGLVAEAVLTDALLVSTGSFPVASWTKISDQRARNVAVASAATRRRMIATLRFRARARSATRPLSSGRALGRACRRLSGSGRAYASEGVIVTSGISGAWCR
jgi:hypothetical protein